MIDHITVSTLDSWRRQACDTSVWSWKMKHNIYLLFFYLDFSIVQIFNAKLYVFQAFSIFPLSITVWRLWLIIFNINWLQIHIFNCQILNTSVWILILEFSEFALEQTQGNSQPVKAIEQKVFSLFH